MKVYLVESLECDWDTHKFVDGVFVSAELAEKFIRQRYSMVEVADNYKGNNYKGNNYKGGDVSHFYGYCTDVPESEIHQNEDGEYYYNVWCEDDQEWCVESIGNPYSVKIKEIDVIEVLDDLEVLGNDS